ncbi:TPA: ABC transporter permease [Vibrio cholerae]|nr:ABC transporter permease [Vibrio cholerae]
MDIHRTTLSFGVRQCVANATLIRQSLSRDFVSRYKGSSLGMVWAFLMPLLLLAVYTFVFSVIFKAKWGGEGEQSRVDFALILFVGMAIYNFFSEVLVRSPTVFLQNVNFVKKVVYPLEILPLIIVLSAFLNMCISLVIWGGAVLVLKGALTLSLLLFPLIALPLVVGTLGVALLLSSIGTYIRDVSQITGVLATMLMFLSPVFFSLETIPEQFRQFFLLNPLTFFIEESRKVLFFDTQPNYWGILGSFIISAIVLKFGFYWFQKTRGGFADVL